MLKLPEGNIPPKGWCVNLENWLNSLPKNLDPIVPCGSPRLWLWNHIRIPDLTELKCRVTARGSFPMLPGQFWVPGCNKFKLIAWFPQKLCHHWSTISLRDEYVICKPIGSMYATYGNICHQYTPNVRIYTSTMDPMGKEMGLEMTCCSRRTERNGFKMREGNQTGSDLDWRKLGFSQSWPFEKGRGLEESLPNNTKHPP